MNDEPKSTSENEPTFAAQVGAKASRKLKARRNSAPGVWFGLGMMGLIGWSVVVPTLLGAALGSGWTHDIRARIPGRWRCWWPGSSSAA
jgi:ATP synthase protein I